MENVVENFKTSAANLKNVETGVVAPDECSNLYELAEQVVLQDGVGGFEREFSLLKEIINSTKPVPIDFTAGEDEKNAWYEMMSRALNKGVVEHLTEDQKIDMLKHVGQSDDGLDIWICDNIDDLEIYQINQLYLAQTIGFYYYFSNLAEFAPDTLDGVLNHLYDA